MKIKDVCSRFSSGDFISADKIYSFGNYPVYGGNGLRGYTDNYNFDGECAIIGRQGAYSGNVKFFSGKGHMTEHAIVAIGNENNNTRFLAYKFGLMNLGRYAGQSAQPGLSVETLLNLDIDLPSKDNQDKIATVLSYLDNKIELNKKINATLEAMAKTLYDYWFVQFDFPDENGKPYKTSGGKMIYNAELGREIPVDWKAKKLSDFVNISTESINPTDSPEMIYEHYSIPAYDDKKFPSFEKGIDINSNKYLVKPCNILYAKLNPSFKRIWKPLCLTKNAICSTEFIVLAPHEEKNYPYIYATLNDEVFQMYMIKQSSSSTGSRKRVQPDNCLSYPIILPDTKIISRFNKIYSNILNRINLLIIENQRLAALRDWLLPMLMNGQVRFKD